MRVAHDTYGVIRCPLVVLGPLVAILHALPLRLHAQDYAARTAAAVAYIASHADREEQVMMPMRDGVRLSALILFPKDQQRRNLPTVLFRNPYLTEGMV